MDNLIGQSLGRYRIDSLLGEGGMGSVYKATDVTLQRLVALKVMHPQLSHQEDFQKRFLNEARTAAQLDHPGIVKVHDFGRQGGMLYIVMEYLAGDNLRQLLQKLQAERKWMVLSEAVPLLRQVCEAVDFAHRQGVLHRDLKPGNIMLKNEASEGLPYRPVLTDLGLARLLDGSHMTQTGISVGTPAYMSPEQALGDDTDARSDIYSLGVLLYELAVGQLPFPFKTMTEAIRYHSKDVAPPPPPPRTLRPDLPESVEQVILRAMDKDPLKRFQSAGAMAKELGAISAASLTGTNATTLVDTVPGGVSSLMTAYQQSIIAGRGESVLKEFPSPDTGSRQDRISILAPDHTLRSVLVKKEGMTIGRGSGADISLEDDHVSRRHAQVSFDGTNYLVTDLSTTNGTFLANIKLLPEKGEIWTPDKPLRIGRHFLRLERTQPSTGMPFSASTGPAGTIAAPQGPSGTRQGRVGVFLEKSEFTVAPGSNFVMPLPVINQGEVVDKFEVSVLGVPTEWVTVEAISSEGAPSASPFVQLLPGVMQQVQLNIHPPRASSSRAGTYPLKVRVASTDAPDQVAELAARLTVTPYHQLSSTLVPQTVQAQRPAQFRINNQGNAPEAVRLTWQDPAQELLFTPAQTQVTVPEGQESAVSFRGDPRHRRWLGGAKQHSFVVQLQAAEVEAQSQQGQLVSYGVIPTWLPPLLLVALLLLCGALYALLVKAPVVEAFERNSLTSVRWRVTNCESVELRDGTETIKSSLPCTSDGYPISGKPGFPANLNLVARNAFAPLVGVAIGTPVVAFVPPTPLPTAVPPAPVITLFSVDPLSIVAGQSVTIRWEVSNARSIQLKSGDAINTVANSGSMLDSPDQLRTYTLIVQPLAAGQDPIQRSFEVRVATPVPTPNAAATTGAQQTSIAATQTARAMAATQTAAAQQTAQAMSATQTAAAQQTAQAIAATQTAASQQTAQAIAATRTAVAATLTAAAIFNTPPLQLSPANGSVFSIYPRTTTLQWRAVPGATSYTVEIDCFLCCANNQWCTDVGKTWQVVPNITTNTYKFDFVGAQPGRWRVRAVFGGQQTPMSGWWTFSYTR